MDVVVINWRARQILLGECKWGVGAVARGGAGWVVHYAFFARAGFTDAVQALAATHDALLVDLARLDGIF